MTRAELPDEVTCKNQQEKEYLLWLEHREQKSVIRNEVGELVQSEITQGFVDFEKA